jgi:hypothetical protein
MSSNAMVQQAASIVRRTRAGDQNAWAIIYKIGEQARTGRNPRAVEAYTLVRSYIEHNPSAPFQLGEGKPVVIDTPGGMVPTRGLRIQQDPEMRKPPLPKGVLNGILDPDMTARCILNACQFRRGLQGAAVALAAGPMLSDEAVRRMAANNFGADDAKRAFMYGVRFCGEREWNEVAPSLNMASRKGLVIGQCVGRARHLQAIRSPRSKISVYSSVAGWELGE